MDKDILDRVLTEHQKISDAQNGPADPNEDRDLWESREREIRYKATDGAGNVYLLMNPAAWPEVTRREFVASPNGRDEHSGRTGTWVTHQVKVRPPHKLVLSASAAQKAAAAGSISWSSPFKNFEIPNRGFDSVNF